LKKENETSGKAQQLEEREKKCVEKEKELEAREQKVKVNEERWTDTEKRMQQNAAKLPSVIQISVCGTKFAIAKENLLKHKGSLFEQMILTDHSQQLPSTGELFFERNPKLFKYIIHFLIFGEHPPLQTQWVRFLEKEFQYFNIPVRIPEAQPKSILLEGSDFGKNITEWLPDKRFQLLYKATEDGFGCADFHKQCDNKGSTLTLISSKDGHLFGGYSVLPWDSTNSFKRHAEGFIFTLSNPHNIPPTKYTRNLQNTYSICGHVLYGPIFGAGHDIIVASDSHQNTISYTHFTSYTDTTGKGDNTFTGASYSTTTEIEVFSVI